MHPDTRVRAGKDILEHRVLRDFKDYLILLNRLSYDFTTIINLCA
jgi:hypothetical protein